MKLFTPLKSSVLTLGVALTFLSPPSSVAELPPPKPKKKIKSCKNRYSGEALLYHGFTKDGRCVWSCGVGTRPDFDSGECKCQDGKIETGKDKFKRRVCK